MSCVAVLGGSFDPVHNGHVALARYFLSLLAPDEIRIIPAGNPWQKAPLRASGNDRARMVQLAFADLPVRIVVDMQEVERSGPSYSIDTLRALRLELGSQTSIAFLMGADQLHQLPSWHEWRGLFDLAHICVAARPGFTLQTAHLPNEVEKEFSRRTASPDKIRSTPAGLTLLATDLAEDVSSTAIRSALEQGQSPAGLLPPGVLDYIQLHHLYQSNGN